MAGLLERIRSENEKLISDKTKKKDEPPPVLDSATEKPLTLINQNKELNRSVTAYSRVLGRDIRISWQGENPKVVYVDRTPFSLDEIKALRGTSPADLKKAYLLKEAFDGCVTTNDGL
ncbi:hypothetical protein PITCH_A1960003 [uncultured Desulfobacterium sp.]|uniref:Uncharacterized protein n=1 Tax=uncultured Desulfobacterium sp. TaxID=201089 RepID=A0A445MW59_9BACT|nr:hypothetical protein PITCH_A1960003 [uncultured Desulfobacterium sp.]